MINSPPPLHVWIFNDASIASLLHPESPLWPDLPPAALLEFAPFPTLARAFGLPIPPDYTGWAGLLNSHAPFDSVALRPSALPFPILCAPDLAPDITAAVAAAILRRLRAEPGLPGPRVLLVESSLVDAILPALALADRLGIAWDLSTPPGPQLSALLAALEGENLLRPATWAGLLGYLSPDHSATEAERAAAAATLAPLPSARLLAA
jgi:hypothetical protein